MASKPPSAGAFLDFLFTTVAHKPPEMKLREAAAAARYLDELAYDFQGANNSADSRKQSGNKLFSPLRFRSRVRRRWSSSSIDFPQLSWRAMMSNQRSRQLKRVRIQNPEDVRRSCVASSSQSLLVKGAPGSSLTSCSSVWMELENFSSVSYTYIRESISAAVSSSRSERRISSKRLSRSLTRRRRFSAPLKS